MIIPQPPANLIPSTIMRLPLAPGEVTADNSYLPVVYQGNTYHILSSDIVSSTGVPTSRLVSAGTGLTGGGALSSNITLSIAPGGVGGTELADTGVTAGTYGDSTHTTTTTVDSKGRVISISSTAISGFVTGVGVTAPITSTGGTAPTLSIAKATATADGYLSSTDWSTFDGKQDALSSGVTIKTVNGNTLLGGGNLSVGTVTNVSATGPLSVTNGSSTPELTITRADGSTSGYLTSGDWSTFNGKQDAFGSQLANRVYASPNGAPGLPTFRALTSSDIPSLSDTYVLKSGDTMTGNLTLPASTSSLVPLHLNQGSTPSSPSDGDIWFDQNGIYMQNLSAIHQLDADANAVGALSNAVITLGATTGTINVSSIDVFIYASAGWQGNYMRRTVPAATGLVLTDNSQNYLVVSYNSGSPVYSVTTVATSVNNSNVLLVATMWRTGGDIHWVVVNWGLATATRLNDRLINIQRYVRSSGLMLGESTGNVITSTSGLVWYGIKAYAQGAQSSSSSNCDFYYHSGGSWTHTSVSTYNNTQYDDGTNLVSLGPSKFTVNWVYQFVNGDGLPKLAYYLGSASYSTVAAAAGASQPTPPAVLSQMAVLIGRIIVGTGAAAASQIDSAFTSVFAGTAITDHNSLAGLQGGTSSQYYHLTSAQYTVATQAATSLVNGYLTSTDWSTFNGKQDALGYTAENVANKVTSISSSSTDTQYPSAKCLYTTAQTITGDALALAIALG